MAHWAALRSPRANASEAIRMHPHVPAKAARAGPRPIRQWPEKRSLRLVPRGAQCPAPIDPRHGSRPSDAPAGHGSMAFDVCPVPTGTTIDAQPKRRAALASSKPPARSGSGVPRPSWLSSCQGMRDGQQHSPDRQHTPACEGRQRRLPQEWRRNLISERNGGCVAHGGGHAAPLTHATAAAVDNARCFALGGVPA